MLKGAEAGSDHQLAFARALSDSVSDEAGAAVLRAWLAADEVPEGLSVDADLRWRLLTNLARVGAADQAAIDAELERDPTATGAERAAGARAALPAPLAKAAAWQRATADPSIANETHYQVCSQFWQRGQEDVVRPYAEGYLDVARAISEQRDGWGGRSLAIRKNVLELLFPWPLADRAFLDRLSAWMAAEPLADSVQRVLKERRDDAERALRCQAAAVTS